MFFKRKSKNKNKINDIHNKGNHSVSVEQNYKDFDYDAIKFNEFLTDDQEYLHDVQSKNFVDSFDKNAGNGINSPLGQRFVKDNEAMQFINNTIKANLNKNNLDENTPVFLNENNMLDKMKTKHEMASAKIMEVQSSISKTFDAKAHENMNNSPKIEDIINGEKMNSLKNQNTKLLIPEEIDSMLNNFKSVANEASNIINDVNRVTKQLNSIDEIKMPFTDEFINNQSLDIQNKTIGTQNDINRLDTKPFLNSSFETKALFNENEISNNVNDNFDSLKPIKKEKEIIRINKQNKRDINY